MAAGASYALVGSILVLGGLGYGFDKWRDTSPWGLIIGLTLGIGVGLCRLEADGGGSDATMGVTLLTWVAYAAFLVLRYEAGWRGWRTAYLALAGFALVFPLMMMMTMMAAGGMGGGVTAAMARAMGGCRLDDGRALVVHSALLAVAMSLLFTLFAWTVAPALFRLLGVMFLVMLPLVLLMKRPKGRAGPIAAH